MSLMNYTQFLLEAYGKIDSDTESAKIRLLKTAAKEVMSVDENEYFIALLESGNTSIILEAINTGNYDIINECLLNENFIEKAKEKYQALKDKVKEKGKEALDSMSDASKNLLKIGGNIMKPLKMILQKMGELIKAAWEKGKALTAAAVEKAAGPIKDRLKNLVKNGEKKKSLTEESGSITAMIGGGMKLVTGGWTKMAAKGAESAAQNESLYIQIMEVAMINSAIELIEEGYGIDKINEELLNIDYELFESGHGDKGGLKIPFITAIIDKITSKPPFAQLHSLEAKVAAKANNGLEKASGMIAALDGPGPFKFVVIGGLVGIAAGYAVEQLAKKALFQKDAAGAVVAIAGAAIPGVSTLYSIIKYTGYAVAIHGIIKEVVGQDEGGEDDHGHDDKDHGDEKHSEEKKSEEKDKEKESK